VPFGRRSKPRVDPQTGELLDQPKQDKRPKQGEQSAQGGPPKQGKESDLVARMKDAAREAVVRATSTKP
jgi:hypothetical protein